MPWGRRDDKAKELTPSEKIQEFLVQIEQCKLSQVVNLERKLDANEMFALCDAMEITPVELSKYTDKDGGEGVEEK